jgi:hypothetical protein
MTTRHSLFNLYYKHNLTQLIPMKVGTSCVKCKIIVFYHLFFFINNQHSNENQQSYHRRLPLCKPL